MSGIVAHPIALGLFASALMPDLTPAELCSVPDSHPKEFRAG
jgi:hypothetical protein